jgi:CheY-like chemotaxis protein
VNAERRPEMARVLLVHWNRTEAAGRAKRLRAAKHQVAVHSAEGGDSALRALRDDPPDAVVIDLGRLPSQGCEVGAWLRRQKATRHVPIVFVGGAKEKVAQTRKLLPDATYAEWPGIPGAITRARKQAPARPVIPGTMDGYSGTPLPRKLGIKPDTTLTLIGAPDGLDATLGKLPDGVQVRRRARGRSDIILLFVKSRAELDRRFPAAERAMAEGGGLWIAWPKKASGLATDLTQADVRAHGLDRGLVDYKICAIDGTWSGLKFARRRS